VNNTAFEFHPHRQSIATLEIQLQELKNTFQNHIAGRADRLIHHFPIRTTYGYEFVEPIQVLYCEAHGNYSKAHLVDGSHHLIFPSLKRVLTTIQHLYMIRIHQSFAVNRLFAKRIISASKDYIELQGGKKLSISHRKKSQV
jgi:DNA-binding LytR/AlgR family response regulator